MLKERKELQKRIVSSMNSPREKSTRRIFLAVEILLVLVPIVQLAFMGSLNLDSGAVKNLQEYMNANHAFTVGFLADCLKPFAAYLLHLVYKHYSEGDGGYAEANLIVLFCAEMLSQNIVGIAGIGFLIWRTWGRASQDLKYWRIERRASGIASDLSGSGVLLLLCRFVAFASWRLGMGIF